MKRRFAVLAACLLLLGAGHGARATTVTIQVGDSTAVDVAANGATYSDPESGITFWWLQTDDGQGNMVAVDPNNPYTAIPNIEITGLNSALKADPYVTNNISIINPTPVAQTYTITVTLPIAAFPYNATINSSIGVTVTDTTGGSVSASSVSPQGIYSGQVNGVTILTLMPDPTNVSCAGTGCTTTLPDNGGLPQAPAGPGVANSIGIQLKFTLSAFDQVGITSRFEIVNVPEPSVAALVGVGLVALWVARRRLA